MYFYPDNNFKRIFYVLFFRKNLLLKYLNGK